MLSSQKTKTHREAPWWDGDIGRASDSTTQRLLGAKLSFEIKPNPGFFFAERFFNIPYRIDWIQFFVCCLDCFCRAGLNLMKQNIKKWHQKRFQFSAISGALLLGRFCHHSPDWMMGPVSEQSDVVGPKGEGCLVCVEKWWNDDDIDMTLWPDFWRIRFLDAHPKGFRRVCGFSQFSHEVLQDLVVAQPALLRSALYSGRGGSTSAVILPLKLNVDDTIQKADQYWYTKWLVMATIMLGVLWQFLGVFCRMVVFWYVSDEA